jgi:hypothetical protein
VAVAVAVSVGKAVAVAVAVGGMMVGVSEAAAMGTAVGAAALLQPVKTKIKPNMMQSPKVMFVIRFMIPPDFFGGENFLYFSPRVGNAQKYNESY